MVIFYFIVLKIAYNVKATRSSVGRQPGGICRRPAFGTPVLYPPPILACPNRPKGEGQDRGSGRKSRPERVSHLLCVVVHFKKYNFLLQF